MAPSPKRADPDKPLTFWDRTVYGAISAAFGTLLGLAACACLIFAFRSSMPIRAILFASAVYFFVVGMVRGADAAFFVVEAFTSVAGAAFAETGAIPRPGQGSDNRWAAWSSPVLLVGWIVIVGVIAWRG